MSGKGKNCKNTRSLLCMSSVAGSVLFTCNRFMHNAQTGYPHADMCVQLCSSKLKWLRVSCLKITFCGHFFLCAWNFAEKSFHHILEECLCLGFGLSPSLVLLDSLVGQPLRTNPAHSDERQISWSTMFLGDRFERFLVLESLGEDDQPALLRGEYTSAHIAVPGWRVVMTFMKASFGWRWPGHGLKSGNKNVTFEILWVIQHWECIINRLQTAQKLLISSPHFWQVLNSGRPSFRIHIPDAFWFVLGRWWMFLPLCLCLSTGVAGVVMLYNRKGEARPSKNCL